MDKSNAIKSPKQKVITWIITIITTVFAFLMMYPIIYIILGSFKDNKELLLGGSRLLQIGRAHV